MYMMCICMYIYIIYIIHTRFDILWLDLECSKVLPFPNKPLPGVGEDRHRQRQQQPKQSRVVSRWGALT